ncbi:hypothetical protein ACJIZ3_005705 [Penstemon smallii]|uniref:Uncharacterized protein n=1 Tax=Penstemon smallii TaxID=265156 RepID=A0ABD3S5M9_9LAMI
MHKNDENPRISADSPNSGRAELF